MLKIWTLRLRWVFQFIGSKLYNYFDKMFPLPLLPKEGYVWFRGRRTRARKYTHAYSSRPGRLGSKLIVTYLTPFLIISNIGCHFPLSLRRRKASLTVDLVQHGEPSLFGSSSAPMSMRYPPVFGSR